MGRAVDVLAAPRAQHPASIRKLYSPPVLSHCPEILHPWCVKKKQTNPNKKQPNKPPPLSLSCQFLACNCWKHQEKNTFHLFPEALRNKDMKAGRHLEDLLENGPYHSQIFHKPQQLLLVKGRGIPSALSCVGVSDLSSLCRHHCHAWLQWELSLGWREQTPSGSPGVPALLCSSCGPACLWPDWWWTISIGKLAQNLLKLGDAELNLPWPGSNVIPSQCFILDF